MLLHSFQTQTNQMNIGPIEVSRVFENTEQCRIFLHRCASEPVLRLLEGARAVFRLSEIDDLVSDEVRLQTWVVRATVLNTILPFDDPSLSLEASLSQLHVSCSGFPEARGPIETVCSAVRELIRQKQNPKRELLRRLIGECAEDREQPKIGILCKLSNGSSPGWPRISRQSDLIAELKLTPIGTKTELLSEFFDQVVLPCGGANVPKMLLSEIYYAGRTPRVDVLLYHGERLQKPHSLKLPASQVPLELKLFEPVFESTESNVTPQVEEDSRWADDAFWQKLHGAQRNVGHAVIEAHFVLFADGTGCFVPSGQKSITVLRENGSASGSRELFQASVHDLDDSTLLVLREGGSAFLLNEAVC